MYKKLIKVLLIGTLALSLFGCSKKQQPEATYENFYELGTISYMQGDYEAAVAAFEQALELEITEDAVVEMLRSYIATGADPLSIMNKFDELGAKYSGFVPSFKSLYDRMFELLDQSIRFVDADVYLKETDAMYLGIVVQDLTVDIIGSSVPCRITTSIGGAYSATHQYGKNAEGADLFYSIATRYPDSGNGVDVIGLTPDCYRNISVKGFELGDSKEDVLKKIVDADLETIEGITYCTYCDDDATLEIWCGKGHYMGSVNEHAGYSEEEANAGSYFLVSLFSHNISELERYSDRVSSEENLQIGFYFDDNDVLVGYDDFVFKSEYDLVNY